jgi:glycosyltransferase involved in cell wall biosynthesis
MKYTKIKNKPKIALIQLVCPHYRVPFFAKLAEKVDLVLFYGKGEKNGSWKNAHKIEGFEHKMLFSINLKFHMKDFFVRLVWFPTLLVHIYKQKPDIIVSEGFTNIVNNICTWLYCKIGVVPWIIWDSGRKKTKPKGLLRKLVEPLNVFFLKQAEAIIAYGSVAEGYFLSLGINRRKIFIAQNTIDTERCFKEAERIKKSPKVIERVMEKYNLSGKKVILYVGSLEKRKKVNNLMLVFDEIKERYKNVILLIIGDGPEMKSLLALKQEKNIKDCFFLGRITEGIEAYFLLCDIFVQPGWNSLAIIEAMVYGKPLITVSYGGPEYENVENGKNGFIVERDNLVQLKECIWELINNEKLRENIGILAQERIKFFTLDNMVEGFLEAIEYVKK